MDKDRLKGKGKDITGKVLRQAGEWTGDAAQSGPPRGYGLRRITGLRFSILMPQGMLIGRR